MDIERHFTSRPEARMFRSSGWSDLPPAQAGFAAALRRAFDLPKDESERQFEDLLEKIG
jgi:hypothetical protein